MNEYVRVHGICHDDGELNFKCAGWFRRETILRVSTAPYYKDGRFYSVTLTAQAVTDFEDGTDFYVRSLADSRNRNARECERQTCGLIATKKPGAQTPG